MTMKGLLWCGRRISDYLRLSRIPWDWPALALLGLARIGFFNDGRAWSGFARRHCASVNVRTSRLGRLAVAMNPADPSHVDIFDEVVIQNVYDLTLVPFTPTHSVDCGAHLGLFTLKAASHYQSLSQTLFEPAADNLAMLAKTIELNRLSVDLHDEAVSDKDGEATFYQRSSCGGSIDQQAGQVVPTHAVKTIDLASFVEKLQSERLLIKIDVEGAEEVIVPKLVPVLPQTTAIFFETHSGEKGWDQVTAALEAASFEVRLLTRRDPFRDGLAVRT